MSFRSLTLLALLAACAPDLPDDPRSDDVAPAQAAIYGGQLVAEKDAIARSTIALFSEADWQTDHVLVDGSATLVAPNLAVGAAHTCVKFAPAFAAFGPTLPEALPYESFGNRKKFPTVRRVLRCVAHEAYDDDAARSDQQVKPVHDIALFFLEGTPAGFGPARVLAQDAALPTDVTIAGFGAYDGQFDDIYTEGMKPYGLRAVDSFISEVYPASLQFKDGPNPGKGSCQGDSGGSVYVRRTSSQTIPVLAGIPVNGPACDLGIGIDTDVRPHVAWIERVARVTLTVAR
jgi:hypothetical protein